MSEVPLPAGVSLSASSLLWDTSLSSDEDDDDNMLAPQTLLASANGDVSRLVLITADVQHDGKPPAEPCGDLFAFDAALAIDEGWVHVGRGGHLGRKTYSSLQKEGLEHSLAFKCWARGR
jgi:hypothetical protein